MKKVIYWLRRDLRLEDNPALLNASQHDILPVYIYDDVNAGEYEPGEASKVWLHHALIDLQKKFSNAICFYRGDPLTIIEKLIEEHSISAVYWNRCYEPWMIDRDKTIKQTLRSKNIDVFTYNASLLWEPWQILKSDKTPYKVFTPFYRKGCLQACEPRLSISAPKNLSTFKDSSALKLTDLDLLPTKKWWITMVEKWSISEDGARECANKFLSQNLVGYKNERNFPGKLSVSRLSPYLHFGMISPNYVWYQALKHDETDDRDHFLSELGWREFSYYLLFHFPNLPHANFQNKFNAFSWVENAVFLNKWQRGMTGYPIVDAGMRELWQTGYMHNRVRMIVASFLTKNLRIDWRKGERWFWNCLFDADLASNSASWQWVAGSGADAAPYFRIFNPITQGQKFDPEGEYTRRYVPELKNMPSQFLFNPWEASQEVLDDAEVKLGKTYPYPIIDAKQSRQEALDAFHDISK